MTADIAARMRQVVGSPPRLAPLAGDELGERERDIIARLHAEAGHPPDTPAHPFFSTMVRQPDFFEAYMQLGFGAIARATLPQRDRELVILRTGWLCGAPYQFGEHVVIARAVGITAEDIARIKQGSAAGGWSERDRALVGAAEELHADAMISDATWAVLAGCLDPRQLIELTMIVGYYHTTAFIQNSLRFRLNDYNPGLASA